MCKITHFKIISKKNFIAADLLTIPTWPNTR